MKKDFYKQQLNIAAAVFGGLALGAVPFVCQASDYNDVDQVLENKVYIVGSIADINEVRSTLESLKLSGMTGAFVIEAEELKAYPRTVQLITREGHKIILRMKKKAQDVVAPAKQNIAKPSVTTPVRPVETKPAAASKPATIKNEAAKTEAVSTPKTVTTKSATVKNASAKTVEESEIAAARKRLQTEEKAAGTHFVDKLPENVKGQEVKIKPDHQAVEEPQEKTNQALKVVGQPANSNSSNTKISHPLTKKERIARDFLGINEKGEKIALRYPGTAKNVNDVPDWSIASLLKLSDYGLLSPDDVREILSEPDRELMAKMTARAYHLCEEREGNDSYNARFELDKLLKEYDNELRNLGYGAGDYAAYAKLPVDRQTKIGGELRYNYVDHSGDDPYNFYDSRARLRLYVEQPLAEKWTLYGMGEANKSWSGRDYTRFALERLYIGGEYKEVNIKAGRFGVEYGDGNIYDGRMTGVSLSAGNKLKVQADFGRLRENQTGGGLTAVYTDPRYDLAAGVYHFDKDRHLHSSSTIGMLGGMYYIGNFGVGAMYLCSKAGDESGSGYVATVKYGRNRSWIPGTYEIFAKYYDQADSTYIAHTMTGLADYMQGFKGVGFGFAYTLMENVVYSIEYYDLKDKKTGLQGRTIWNHVAYYF